MSSSSNGRRSLASLQQWFQAVITNPEGVSAGIEEASESSAIRIASDELEDVILPSRRVSSHERLSIYAHAYYARLAECMREEFPALLHALGDDTFSAFVAGYLQARPPHSYTLGKLGEGFAAFLAETCPRDDDEASAGWAEFLIDLARLERLYGEVFDGPGDEGETGLTLAQIQAVPPSRRPDVRLLPLHSLRLIELSCPAHDYISAARKKIDTEIPAGETTRLMVWRRNYVVRRLPLSPREYALLQRILQGETLGAAVAAIACDTVDTEHLERDLHNWFLAWTNAGIFRNLSVVDGAE